MKEAELIRSYFSTCIIGCLRVYDTDGHINHNIQTFCTLELPWRDNKKGESCIPEGTYICKRFQSSKFGNTFKVCGVPDRQGILFHTGNTWKSTKGCIILGKSVNLNQEYLCESREAFNEFMQALKSTNEFQLTIKEEGEKKCSAMFIK